MSLHDRILNLACHWQDSNFDIKREIFEMRPSPLSSSFFPSRQKCSSPPSQPPRPPRPPLLVLETVEEMDEFLEGFILTPVYQRRRRCINTPLTMPESSIDGDDWEYDYAQQASSTRFQPSRQALETVWEIESESEDLDTRESYDLTIYSRNDGLSIPPDSPLERAYTIRSSPYATSRNVYSEEEEKFEKIMEQMQQLRRDTSNLERLRESQKEESLGPQCNQQGLQ